ncbi:hypothetical protein [Oligoflexus tunisiensis]|uniref:hypothetical protein n=1 Tax=Oligoflexus tunisiensis TaxID=708132 RepID=UPI00114CF5F0|nr:hypothetical protein [Oligoflexus tunisiensis]
MNPRHEAQDTKGCLGYGAGLLALCMGSGLVFFTLQPSVESHDSTEHEEVSVHKEAGPRVIAPYPDPLPPPVTRAAAESGNLPVITHDVQDVTEIPEDPTPTVEVMAPGKIRLTDEQQEILKGRGSSWGNANPEAEAILRSIPKEAFTSDW